MKVTATIIAMLICPLAARAEDRPNIVLIMADDVGWEAFGCYGAVDYETPYIDALAAHGVRFEHCYSTPICTTSRVMIMTGKYNFRNYTHFGYLDPREKTFANLLQDAGYKTAVAGKWQLNGLYNSLPGHDDDTRPYQAGFDEYCLWQLTKSAADANNERFWSPPLEQNGRFISAQENANKYGPDIFCDFVCDFMQRNHEQPFFVYYPMVLVHSPFVATPKTIGDAPRTQAANKQGRNRKGHFQAMVHYMDEIVGRIVAKSEALGVADNTVILFTADNGTNNAIQSQWNGTQIKGGKGTMTDMGTHVPLVVYRKGHTPSGEVVSDIVDFTDVYPTLANLAGIELGPSDAIDGVSFLPQLRGETGNPRDWIFCHYQPYWNKHPGQFVRTSRYKLYRNGRFLEPAVDLKEQNDLSQTLAGEDQLRIHRQLQSVLELAPPAPKNKSAGRNTQHRPVFPQWQRLPVAQQDL